MEEQGVVRKGKNKSSSELGNKVGLAVPSGTKWQAYLAQGVSEPMQAPGVGHSSIPEASGSPALYPGVTGKCFMAWSNFDLWTLRFLLVLIAYLAWRRLPSWLTRRLLPNEPDQQCHHWLYSLVVPSASPHGHRKPTLLENGPLGPQTLCARCHLDSSARAAGVVTSRELKESLGAQ